MGSYLKTKHTAKGFTFKHFVIGMAGLMVILTAVIIFLNSRPQKLTPLLYESKIQEIATSTIGSSENEEEYIVYFYSDSCSYCTQFMATDGYQDFIANPGIKFYKVSVNNWDSNASDYNPNLSQEYMDDLAREGLFEGTPALVYIKKVGDGHKIDVAVGPGPGENLIKKFIK